jgi:hypothetical protein
MSVQSGVRIVQDTYAYVNREGIVLSSLSKQDTGWTLIFLAGYPPQVIEGLSFTQAMEKLASGVTP